MANSISELEAERAKILEEIENRAKSMSNDTANTSLQDWLKAAEDVVPQSALEAEQQLANAKQRLVQTEQQNRVNNEDIPLVGQNPRTNMTDPYRQAAQPTAASNTLAFSDDDFGDDFSQINLSSNSASILDTDNVNNKTMRQPEANPGFSAQDFAASGGQYSSVNKPNKGPMLVGVAVMLSLFVTVLVVVVLGYNSMHEQISTMQAQNDENKKTIAELQQKIENMPINAEVSLENSNKNQEKIGALQNQLVALEAQLATVRNDLQSVQQANAGQTLDGGDLLQQKIEQVVSALQLSAPTPEDLQPIKPEVKPFKAAVNIAIEPDVEKVSSDLQTSEVAQPLEPMAPEIKQPEVIEQQVATISEPKIVTPVNIEEPKKNYTADVNWLMQQPGNHYTLQLASMLESASIQKMIKDKGITDGRVIPQMRDGKTMFVLIVGSFAERKDANQLASKLKKELNIAPWIRTTDAVIARVE